MVRETRAKLENKQSIKQEIPGRPPVVAVLGHVDHGKTTLLDYIRKSHVAAKEAGGITQHIGAYQIDYQKRKITFIDTPGHEAFSAMRARGGQISDIVVLVIAADDGVMPQTRESIAHIKAAGVPFIVAINKMDLPGVSVDKVKKQLAEEDVLVEGYGGDVVTVLVSAKTGQGTDELLEMICLLADIAELKEEKNNPFSGVVIEARLDKSRGPSASLIVKEGVLRIGEPIATNSASGKTRSLTDSGGRPVREALPSTPVEVLGFTSVPKVGEVAKSGAPVTAQQKKEKPARPSLQDKLAKPAENEIRLILKADAAGSLEAITGAIERLKEDTKEVKVYYEATGDISESDILLAASTGSLIIGFNVGIGAAAEKLASEEGVLIRKYQLIYELLEELEEGLEALKEKKVEEKIYGEAEVIDVFRMEDVKIAGCRVIDGRISKSDTIALKRGGKKLGESRVVSMKHRETNINQASVDEEFGVTFEKDLPFTKGDIIVAISRS
ncbi:MAG: translation initiation factor IF-2 [Candidatus Woykebacteria bacterium RBG_16_44_10]|uniref:Translation initiation factor IF-2 n=1 Tax=Candidatus Woykebacteria bacterium RBG_16_44_10 TaxID=1802597 RepID=A0A1G1WFW1_9BACT|nr:MAG: translation initiation factor IF-2 [Candidatus Woykebacteria bacterium RBG_16_44_10]